MKLLYGNKFLNFNYFDYELSNSTIDIYYYSQNNNELLNIIKDKQYEFIELEKKAYPCIYNFANNVDELSFVFNKINFYGFQMA